MKKQPGVYLHACLVASYLVVLGLMAIMFAVRPLACRPDRVVLLTTLTDVVWPWLFLLGFPLAILTFIWAHLRGQKRYSVTGFVLVSSVILWFLYGA